MQTDKLYLHIEAKLMTVADIAEMADPASREQYRRAHADMAEEVAASDRIPEEVTLAVARQESGTPAARIALLALAMHDDEELERTVDNARRSLKHLRKQLAATPLSDQQRDQIGRAMLTQALTEFAEFGPYAPKTEKD